MSDRVTHTHLQKVANHVMYERLQQFALDLLDFEPGRYSLVVGRESQPWDKAFNVLLNWKQSSKPQPTIDKLSQVVLQGIKKGYLDEKSMHDLSQYCGRDLYTLVQCFEETHIQGEVPRKPPEDSEYDDFKFLQEITRKSFTERPFPLICSKEWTPNPRKFPLDQIYTNLAWVRKYRRPCEVAQEKFDDYLQLLTDKELGDKPIRILVEGEAGIGKTTFVKKLALDWSSGKIPELKKFDFVFVIPLRDVEGSKDKTLEEIIVENHKGLTAYEVQPEKLSPIIKGLKNHNVLIVLDGFDEYTPGTNEALDKLIEKRSLWNLWAMLTSRPSDKVQTIRQFMDAEAQIIGFTRENITSYVGKFLGETYKSIKNELLATAERKGLYDILRIPIILQMVCILYVEERKLPRSKTGVVMAIINRCIRRDGQKRGVFWKDKELKKIILKLGELCLASLFKDTQQLLLKKDDIKNLIGEEVMKLGLLMTADEDVKDCEWLTCQHKMIQEFLGSLFVVEQTVSNPNYIQERFPDMKHVVDHNVILQFCVGLLTQDGEDEDSKTEPITAYPRALTDGTSPHAEASKILLHAADKAAEFFTRRLRTPQPFNKVTFPYKNIRLKDVKKDVLHNNTSLWPGYLLNYMQTVTDVLTSIHNECKQSISPFCNDNLVVLPEGSPSLDLLSKGCQPKLCILHNVSHPTSSPFQKGTHMLQTHIQQYKGYHYPNKQTVMLFEPDFSTNQPVVLPNFGRVQDYIADVRNINMVKFVYDQVSADQRVPMSNVTKALFGNDRHECVRIVECKLPLIMAREMLSSFARGKHLQMLDLSFSPLPGDTGVQLMQNVLGELRDLRGLALRGFELTSQCWELLCKQLVHLVKLTHLNLSLNKVVGKHTDLFTAVIEAWPVNPKVAELYLDRCNIPNDSAKGLMAVLRKCTNLRQLRIGGNDLHDTVKHLVAEPLPSIENLSLPLSELSANDIDSLSTCFYQRHMPVINALDIGGNDLIDEDLIGLMNNINQYIDGRLDLWLHPNKLSPKFCKEWRSGELARENFIIWYEALFTTEFSWE